MGLSSRIGHIQKIEGSLMWAKLRGLWPVARILSDEESLNLEFLFTGCAQNS